jgi:nucleoside-diphosphate-sugar epimerase
MLTLNQEANVVKELTGKRVLVTGAAGFIGSHIVERLLSYGVDVVGLDDLSAGHLRNVEIFDNHKKYTFWKKGIEDSNDWAHLEDIDIVFDNAASKKNICLHDPARDLSVNAGGVLNLLQQASKYKIKKFVHASTGSVYGEPKIFPTTEQHPLEPVSFYGVSKLAGEKYVSLFGSQFGLDTTNLRYFHVYGPRQESNEFGGVAAIFSRNVINNEPLIVHGSGQQMRSFTWVGDLVDANMLAAISRNATGKTYNVASGIQIKIIDLAHRIVELSKGSKSYIVHGDRLVGDIDYFDVSSDAIKNDLGLQFETDFWTKFENIYDCLSASVKNQVHV